MTDHRHVDTHYRRDGIADRILAEWRAVADDLRGAGPAELPPLDEMHVRSRVATAELAAMAHVEAGSRVLDAGSGLGGAARYLAATFGCKVVGVDLTATLCAAARSLSEALGLNERTRFVRGSATALPVAAGCFDVVWTQHAQMNIADKASFYSALAAAVAPGGTLLFHDIFAAEVRGAVTRAADLDYPVPWAGDASISHLCGSAQAHGHLAAAGLRQAQWVDRTAESLQWADGVLAQRTMSGPGVVMGSTASEKLGNLAANLRAGRLQVVMARYERPAR